MNLNQERNQLENEKTRLFQGTIITLVGGCFFPLLWILTFIYQCKLSGVESRMKQLNELTEDEYSIIRYEAAKKEQRAIEYKQACELKRKEIKMQEEKEISEKKNNTEKGICISCGTQKTSRQHFGGWGIFGKRHQFIGGVK
jgi:hypothetical protein